MPDVLRIKRRAVGGAAGAPASLAAAEIAFNEQDEKLYYGKGNSGGLATSIIPIAGPGTLVRYDAAQTLTDAQQQQARKNIFASPLDALGLHNLLINSGADWWQEYPGFAVNSGGNLFYAGDVWRVTKLGFGGTFYLSRFNSVGLYIPWGINMQATAAITATPAAGDLLVFGQPIEGSRMAGLNWGNGQARPITISFWCLSTIAGTIPISIRNNATDRSYVTNITISSGGAWEYKQVTIPGDTTGTWLTDSGVGMWFNLCLASGANSRAPALDAWQAGNYTSHAAQTNFFTTTNNVVYFSGITMVPGSQGPASHQNTMLIRPRDTEIELIKRWYQKSYNLDVAPGAAANPGQIVVTVPANSATATEAMHVRLPCSMRSTPTITIYNSSTGASGQVQIYNVKVGVQTGNANVANIGHNSFQIGATGLTGHAVGDCIELWGQYAASARP